MSKAVEFATRLHAILEEHAVNSVLTPEERAELRVLANDMLLSASPDEVLRVPTLEPGRLFIAEQRPTGAPAAAAAYFALMLEAIDAEIVRDAMLLMDSGKWPLADALELAQRRFASRRAMVAAALKTANEGSFDERRLITEGPSDGGSDGHA